MSPQEAKEELLETIHDEVTRESAVIIRDAETRTKAEADKKAREILSLAIQRVRADHSAEHGVHHPYPLRRSEGGPHHRPRGAATSALSSS